MGVTSSKSTISPTVDHLELPTRPVHPVPTPENTLFFPPETLLKIVAYLTPRDKLIARQVCHNWNAFLTRNGEIESEVILHVQDSEKKLGSLARPRVRPIWNKLTLINLDLRINTFWSTYGDFITELRLINCSTMALLPEVAGQFKLGCNNLKSLTMNNCGKYFLMGNNFVQVHKILNIENLESLDLSDNMYLNDRILFSFLKHTKNLKSLNLAGCSMTFANSIYQRFYPPSIQQLEYPECCSDYILSFQLFYSKFLSGNQDGESAAAWLPNTPHNLDLNELVMDLSSIDQESLKKLAEANCTWKSIGLNQCNEIKEINFQEFIEKQNCVQKLCLQRLKFTDTALNTPRLMQLTYLDIRECTEIRTLEFLKILTNLEYLDISYCTAITATPNCLSGLVKLKVLKMRGIVPFYVQGNDNNQTAASQILANEFCKLKQMRELDIGLCGSIVNDNVMQAVIMNMRDLRVLKICKAPVSDRGLTGMSLVNRPDGATMGCISRLDYLRELSLAQCELLGRLTWKYGLEFPSLRTLNLTKCLNLDRLGLLDIMQNCKSLEELSITNSVRLSDDVQIRATVTEDAEILASIKKLPRLRDLKIISINQ